MPAFFKEYLKVAPGLVSILIVFVLLSGCSSRPVVDVRDSSIQAKSTRNVHVVAQGETLYSIAWRYRLDYRTLADFNGINPPYTIHRGQKIRVNNRPPVLAQAAANRSTARSNVYSPKEINSGSQEGVSATKRSEIKPTFRDPISSDASLQSTLKWQWPAAGKILAQFQGTTSFNKGIDLEGKLGESVVAAAAGQVVYAGSGLRGYGKLLIIKHNELFLSAYAHNNELLIKEGDFVKVGQRIADMGSSGTDRIKLHFEIRNNGSPVDPLKYLPKR